MKDNYIERKGLKLYTKQRDFVNEEDGKVVSLIGMIHIAPKAFYDKVSKSITPGSIVLTEGVNDNFNLMAEEKNKSKTYSLIANSLGWVRQSFKEILPKDVREINADVDFSELSQDAVEFSRYYMPVMEKMVSDNLLESDFSVLLNSKGIKEKLLDINAEYNEFRTERLCEHFDNYEDGATSIVIPWGAMHLKDVEEYLKSRKYVLLSEKKIYVANLFSPVLILIKNIMKSYMRIFYFSKIKPIKDSIFKGD